MAPKVELNSAELEECLRHNRLNEFRTARELGLGIGDKIRLYQQPAFEHVVCTLSDIVGEAEPHSEVEACIKVSHGDIWVTSVDQIDVPLPSTEFKPASEICQ